MLYTTVLKPKIFTNDKLESFLFTSCRVYESQIKLEVNVGQKLYSYIRNKTLSKYQTKKLIFVSEIEPR